MFDSSGRLIVISKSSSVMVRKLCFVFSIVLVSMMLSVCVVIGMLKVSEIGGIVLSVVIRVVNSVICVMFFFISFFFVVIYCFVFVVFWLDGLCCLVLVRLVVV